jgi:2-polyprenyl-3-methyl-5-hydroxy-6-metoxy-1,4-benzoquinol methylase
MALENTVKGSPLVRLIGFPATLIHGDTLVLDRWQWLSRRVPVVREGSLRLLDAGCGQGAFTIGMALRGYVAHGLSWDEAALTKARERAEICKARTATFDVQDVRTLDRRDDLKGAFDVVMCTEVIEHILDDAKVMQDLANALKPGGRLLLTAPNADYRPMTHHDAGPFSTVEDGGHVRKGYRDAELRALCVRAGLTVEGVSYCSGFFSQKSTAVLRTIAETRLGYPVAWATTLALRPLAPMFDRYVEGVWPGYSICIEARKAWKA